MIFENINTFTKQGKNFIKKGPIALIFIEDLVEISSTIEHHVSLGFKAIILFTPEKIDITAFPNDNIYQVLYNTRAPEMLSNAINKTINALPNMWMYYCYNAEYLFFPFSETRSIADLLCFHTEERRSAMLAYVIDLYAKDINQFPSGVSLKDAHLDKSGYYAYKRFEEGEELERQLECYGGLHWRFEEEIPFKKRRIDRIALFKSTKGLKINEEHLFNIAEYNTYSCPWHHNLTASICSFKAAKALTENTGSSYNKMDFAWHNSIKFNWESQQLLNLGLMEPGQWF